MDIVFEELDFQSTPLGDISLRRRSEPRLDGKILYEVKLGDEFLMSSLFTEAEIQLSKLGLAALKESGYDKELDIVVGGLGLGYTAVAALESKAVSSLTVIEVMQPVINWHQQGVLPVGDVLAKDPRCKLLHGDFFAISAAPTTGFDAAQPDKKAHGLFLDIDHSPSHWLNPQNSSFYQLKSLQNLIDKLHPGGIFGLWSDDPPDEQFMDLLNNVFESAKHHSVFFPNPYLGEESANTVYLARTRK